MNENIDLTKILDGCPYGTEFYHAGYGRVWLANIYPDAENVAYPIELSLHENYPRRFDLSVTARGTFHYEYEEECLLFPSKDQRDWSKFVRFWDTPKVDKFDVNALQPFDKVLVRDFLSDNWMADFFEKVEESNMDYYNVTCVTTHWIQCIPYNKETKHLLGRTDDCPDYYKWWEE